MAENKIRDIRLDIIRIFSLLCVVSIHFFMNSGFYDYIISGKKMLIMCIIRSLFIIAVPMFITLTGYLMCNKTLSKNYYKGMIKTIIIYILCSITYFLFSKYYLKVKTDNNFLLITNILSFNGTPYSWYIEMYIGLFLLIPFLNLIFNNLKTKKDAQKLIITLIFLIGLPSIMNLFKTTQTLHTENTPFMKIFPSWWSINTYPIFYYFLGAYLRNYEVKLNKRINILMLILILILDGSLNFYKSYNAKFLDASWNYYGSGIIMLTTFLVFNLLLKFKLKKENKTVNSILKSLSELCLGAYLVSCIFDNIYYTYLNNKILLTTDRFIYAPLIVIASFISSFILSYLINSIYKICTHIINKIFILFKQKVDKIKFQMV